ncbi:MAG: hypothetical protein DVB23_000263 [Verrucomicrobia bacterium]|nr:MAG: hypothetical protein DVB23_000263 [Verrucomicrobiota bacterium]
MAAPPFVPEKSDLSRYEVLWQEPLFARPTKPDTVQEGSQDKPQEAADHRLAGWGEVGGVETAVIFNRTTMETFVLDSSQERTEQPMHLLQLERGNDQHGPEALVTWQGQTFWISTSQPGDQADELAPGLVVDSRSARLDAPVLLTKDATMGDWTKDAEPGKTEQPSRMQELRERHQRLQEMFGR